MIPTLLSMWTCGLLLAAVLMPQEKVAWAYWRFTVLLSIVAVVAVACFVVLSEVETLGSRTMIIVAAIESVLAAALWLGLLLRSGGKPMSAVSGRIGPLAALVGGLFCMHGFATAARVLDVPPGLWAGAALLMSAGVVGLGTTAAMLGHAYLTAKTMPIDPLRRTVAGYGVVVALHLIAGAGVCWQVLAASRGMRVDPFWTAVVIMYGLIGLAAPVFFAIMAWQAVAVRNTQSTTGIMYFAMVLNFIGTLALCFLLRGEG